MPGIYGFYSREPLDRAQIEIYLKKMSKTLSHDGNYINETWLGKNFGIGVIWLKGNCGTRLLANANNTKAAAIGGYVYGQKGIRNISFLKTLLMPSFKKQKKPYLGFEGSYQAVLADIDENQIEIWNDELGQRLLYLYKDENFFCFAPEVKAILALKKDECTIDTDGLCDYINYGYPLGTKTFFKEIHLLKPGSHIIFGKNKSQTRISTYHVCFDEDKNADINTYIDELAATYPVILRSMTCDYSSHLIPLTGGLDSRFILGNAVKIGLHPTCYTHGSRRCLDYKIAREVSTALKTKHDLIQIDPIWLVDNAKRFVFYTDGMVFLQPATLLGVMNCYNSSPTETCFLNGIFGGPINFGSGYFNLTDYNGYKGDSNSELNSLKRTLFIENRNEAFWKTFSDEFRLLLKKNMTDSLKTEFEKHKHAGPSFYQKKDSFFIQNRLLRLMNMIDVNRFHWHDHFALSHPKLFTFYRRMPGKWKLNRYFLYEYFKKIFPELASIKYKSTGANLYCQPSTIQNRQKKVRQNALYGLERLFKGKICLYDSNKYYHYDQWYRSNENLRNFFYDLLLSTRTSSRGFLNIHHIEKILYRQDRGGDSILHLMKLASFELFFRIFID